MSNINRKFLFKWIPLIQAERMIENIDVFDFVLNEEEMNKISALDMGYSGTRAKHFEPDFVRMVLNKKIHD